MEEDQYYSASRSGYCVISLRRLRTNKHKASITVRKFPTYIKSLLPRLSRCDVGQVFYSIRQSCNKHSLVDTTSEDEEKTYDVVVMPTPSLKLALN